MANATDDSITTIEPSNTTLIFAHDWQSEDNGNWAYSHIKIEKLADGRWRLTFTFDTNNCFAGEPGTWKYHTRKESSANEAARLLRICAGDDDAIASMKSPHLAGLISRDDVMGEFLR